MLLLHVLTLAASAQPGNLVLNGSFETRADPAQLPGVETRPEVFVAPITTNDVQGWHFPSGHPALLVPRRGGGRYVRLADATLTQEVVTQAGHSYRFRFLVMGEAGTPAGTAAQVHFGKLSARQDVQAGRLRGVEWVVKADSDLTELRLASQGGKPGVLIGKVELFEFDPALESVKAQLLKNYAGIDRARKRGTVDAVRPLLTTDFSAQLSGATRDLSGYLGTVTEEASRAPGVSTSISNLRSLPDGALEAEVERRSSYNGSYGKRVTDVVRFRDVWVNQGGHWLWRSSEELSRDAQPAN